MRFLCNYKYLCKRWFKKIFPWGRANRLEKALDEATDIGIYPKAVVGGPNPYEKRSDYQNGWNAALREVLKTITPYLKDGDW